MPRDAGYLYAIQAEGTHYVKVGSTTGTVEQRLRVLKTGQPLVLTILAAIKIDTGLADLERHIHTALATKRRTGEWFELTMDAPQFLQFVEKEQQRVVKKSTRQPRRLQDDLPIFYERLARARKRAGISQGTLAKLTQMYPSDISKMERGGMLPTAPRLRRLALALDVSSDFLLGIAPDTEHTHAA